MVDMDLEGILEGLTLDEKTDENSRSSVRQAWGRG